MGGTSFDRPLTMESILNAIYPVGSIYTSVQSTSPAILFGGTWTQIKGSFLYACEDSGITAGGTGGAKSVSYTPAGSNSGGSVGSHTLTTAEIPSHSHGLNSHKHSVGAHAHGLNSHKHSVGAHAHGLNSHTHAGGSHNHGMYHTHKYNYASSIDANSNNTSSTTINFSNGYACAHLTTSRWLEAYEKAVGSWTCNYYAGQFPTFGNETVSYTTGVGLLGSQAHTHTLNGHYHSITTGTTNTGGSTLSYTDNGGATTGAASGNTANSTAFDSGAASGNTANSTAFDSGAASGNTASSGDGGGHNHGFTNPTFTGTAATIATMPPYLAVYMWKRTA